MSSQVVIGKYAIESLTTGMYTEPYVIYREYIQNAADALDVAIQRGVISRQEALIRIRIDAYARRIIIEDNGSGITQERAYRILTDIGNSEKIMGENRGFRGIGRFSGLSYCDRLVFETTAEGQGCTYSIAYNAAQLRRSLTDDNSVLTASDAMLQVISERHYSCESSTHYFRVILEGVMPDTGLLDAEKVKKYLQQTAPVDFSTSFTWSVPIHNRVSRLIGEPPTYAIQIESAEKKSYVYKAYEESILLNRRTGETDKITSISYFPVKIHGKVIGCAWYGNSSYAGTIINRDVKGIRIRVGNILIGDEGSLNHVFKDSRFNGWVIGEVYIKSDTLIPNARRDGFEHNDNYYAFVEQMQVLAAEISKKIRSASVRRNQQLRQAVRQIDTIQREANALQQEEQVSPSRRGNMTMQIASAKSKVENIQATDVAEDVRQDVIEMLDVLTGRIKGMSSFRSINVLENLSKSDRLLLEKLFVGIKNDYSEDEAEKCISMILNVLSK